jgi:hypothetical protein
LGLTIAKLIVLNSYFMFLRPWTELHEVLCEDILVLFRCSVKKELEKTFSISVAD